MKQLHSLLITLLILFTTVNCQPGEKQEDGLKDALADHFLMGVALNRWQVDQPDSTALAVVTKHFNSIVAENCMKSEKIQPREGEFFFEDADRFIEFGEQYNMQIVGHCLIWHSQAPRWFFTDDEGNEVSREVLIDRMETHIKTLVGRYRGRIDGWDVVNECFNDDGTLRNSRFLQIIGEDYIRLAFEFAHAADPETELYLNDYNTMKPEKREAIYQLVKNLQAEGVRVDGIGMQGHLTMTFPEAEEMEKSIVKFAELGTVMITELDMTVLPWPSRDVSADVSLNYAADPVYNPYPNGLTDSASVVWTERYMDFFNVFIKHSDKISRVTMWGLNDGQTWRNNWPIRGRSDYPVLFDRENQAKPVVNEIIKAAAASK